MVVLRSAKPALFLYFWLGYALYTPATLTLALGAIDTNQSVVNTSPPRLSCHMCESFIDDDECVHLAPNSSTFSTPCKDNQISCTVKRYTFTINATSAPQLWSVSRNCSSECEPGCLIIGERTKLRVCTSCCDQPDCNRGNRASHRHQQSFTEMIIIISFVYAEKILFF